MRLSSFIQRKLGLENKMQSFSWLCAAAVVGETLWHTIFSQWQR